MTIADHNALRSWNKTFVSLLESAEADMESGVEARLGGSSPTQRLAAGVASFVPHELWWMLFLNRSETAILHEYYNPSLLKDHYTDGPYLVDPIYISFKRGDPPGLYQMRKLARIYPTGADRYFEYDWTLHGRIDEIGLTYDMDSSTRAVFAIARRVDETGANRFTKTEVAYLDSLSPVVEVVCHRLWRGVEKAPLEDREARENRHNKLTEFLSEFGRGHLTDREAEIGNLLIKGFNAKDISRILKISIGTTRNHMKKVYCKLEVASQSELCGVFIEQLLSAQSK